MPDFQRSWVWEEERIMSLIASVSRGFPMGALMSLKSKIDTGVVFAYRPIEGTPVVAQTKPEQLLLDGQQRMTSLYQSCMRRQVVSTITAKKRLIKRWFYIDMMKAMNSEADRESAIFAVPEDRKLKENFDKDIVLNLSSPELEYEQLMYPLNQAFSTDPWMQGFWNYWNTKGESGKIEVFFRFKNEVLNSFSEYQVPVIALGADTSHEAVCLVFEKVNTGGKSLDAFELLTAMYAAQGHKLRDDWLGDEKADNPDRRLGIQKRLANYGRAAGQVQGVLANVASTDFLQAIALLHTKELRLAAIADPSKKESDWPAVRATRQSLLDLPLAAYKKYSNAVQFGFERAAKFLRQQQIHRVGDLPYQTQLVPLAAIFAEIGDKAEHATNNDKIARWYWCGVFGELYGSTVESRFSKDILEMPVWLDGGAEPSTVADGVLRAERLLTMRSRLSAAYKGLQALLLRQGAIDFRSGQTFDQTIFFDEGVDIHHIFPKDWCEKQSPKLPASLYDSVVNKTPLGYRTNRIIGGVAPSSYLEKLENGKAGPNGQIIEPPIEKAALATYLKSHCIPVPELYANDFDGFMKARQKLLLDLVARTTGNAVFANTEAVDEGDEIPASMAQDSGLELIEAD
ncbi:GmrSD restriction endonuclease domain-containing protein [Propionivibrio sp.]|uniref:GmrSD restriction endonuclease domain-containing protein n=1 Tax=Propionivibrio sp. TaxID=2212460 RepID=UPI003BF241B3